MVYVYMLSDVLLGSTEYSTSLDMWGVGCIFVEMASGIPTFPGVRDTCDQLDKIFKVRASKINTIRYQSSLINDYCCYFSDFGHAVGGELARCVTATRVSFSAHCDA